LAFESNAPEQIAQASHRFAIGPTLLVV